MIDLIDHHGEPDRRHPLRFASGHYVKPARSDSRPSHDFLALTRGGKWVYTDRHRPPDKTPETSRAGFYREDFLDMISPGMYIRKQFIVVRPERIPVKSLLGG